MNSEVLILVFFGAIAFLVAVAIVVGTAIQAWQNVRRGEQEAILKREMLERGLSAEEIERVLRASSQPQPPVPLPDDRAVEVVSEHLGAHGTSGRVIEQVLTAVRLAEPALKRTLCNAVQAVLDNSSLQGDAKDEQVLAVVRGLSAAERPPTAPAKVEETFQPVRPL